MDNLAHTLCGTALVRARLAPPGRLAAVTLVVAANAPDVDAIYYLLGDDAGALLHRRGWTHSLVGYAIEIPLLAALMRWCGARLARGGPAPAWRPLLIAAAIGYTSHLLLDLLNTYGVRFLLPFTDRWFRADAAFIVDPWMWWLFASATLTGGGVRRGGWALWGAFVAFGVWAMQHRGVPAAAPILWASVMALTGLVRLVKRAPSVGMARGLVAGVALYLVGLEVASCRAREVGVEFVAAQGEVSSTVNPAPAVPWRHTVVVASREEIQRVAVELGGSTPPRVTHRMRRHLDDPALDAVRHTREYRAWRRFARHPFVARDGGRLVLGDGRYSTGNPGDWCNLTLPLPAGEQ